MKLVFNCVLSTPIYVDDELQDGHDEQKFASGDFWRQTAEKMNENASGLENVIYKWNGPLYATVEAGLEHTTHVDACDHIWPQSKPNWPKSDPRLTGNWSEAGLDTTNLDVVKVVTIISYLLTFVVGFTGNTLVLYVVGRFPVVRRKSVANYYIWNLALADELYVLALPLFCWATYRSVRIRDAKGQRDLQDFCHHEVGLRSV